MFPAGSFLMRDSLYHNSYLTLPCHAEQACYASSEPNPMCIAAQVTETSGSWEVLATQTSRECSCFIAHLACLRKGRPEYFIVTRLTPSTKQLARSALPFLAAFRKIQEREEEKRRKRVGTVGENGIKGREGRNVMVMTVNSTVYV